jgi:hypothetical protein
MYKNTPPEKIETFEGIETTFAQTRAESPQAGNQGNHDNVEFFIR